MTDDIHPPDPADNDLTPEAIEELMAGPVAVYQPRKPSWSECA